MLLIIIFGTLSFPICEQCYIYSRRRRRKTDSFEILLAEVRVIRLVCSVKLKD